MRHCTDAHTCVPMSLCAQVRVSCPILSLMETVNVSKTLVLTMHGYSRLSYDILAKMVTLFIHDRSILFMPLHQCILNSTLTWLIIQEGLIAYYHHEHFPSYINVVKLWDSSVTEPQVNKGAVGKAFKKDAKAIIDYLAVLDEDSVTEMEKSLANNG